MNFDRDFVAKNPDKTLFVAFERAQMQVFETVLVAKTGAPCAAAQAEVDRVVDTFNP